LNYKRLTGLGDQGRKPEGSNTRLPKVPKYNDGDIKSEGNLLDVVEWFDTVEALFRGNRFPITDWFEGILPSLNSTDRHHATTNFRDLQIRTEEQWIVIFRKPFIRYAGGDFHEYEQYESLLTGGAAIFRNNQVSDFIKLVQ
jgi:hypothetical protein